MRCSQLPSSRQSCFDVSRPFVHPLVNHDSRSQQPRGDITPPHYHERDSFGGGVYSRRSSLPSIKLHNQTSAFPSRALCSNKNAQTYFPKIKTKTKKMLKKKMQKYCCPCHIFYINMPRGRATSICNCRGRRFCSFSFLTPVSFSGSPFLFFCFWKPVLIFQEARVKCFFSSSGNTVVPITAARLSSKSPLSCQPPPLHENAVS